VAHASSFERYIAAAEMCAQKSVGTHPAKKMHPYAHQDGKLWAGRAWMRRRQIPPDESMKSLTRLRSAYTTGRLTSCHVTRRHRTAKYRNARKTLRNAQKNEKPVTVTLPTDGCPARMRTKPGEPDT